MFKFQLTENEKATIISIARETLNTIFSSSNQNSEKELTAQLNMPCGVFVSLYLNESLRGCIGYLESKEPLYSTLAKATRSAALHDHRFESITQTEYEKLSLEISILTPLKKIESIQEIELGKHGIVIKKGTNSGTFLPQVAKKTNWNLIEFISHCSRDKVGIGWNGWRNAEIYTYEAIIIKS